MTQTSEAGTALTDSITFRQAVAGDLSFLLKLEQECFSKTRQSTRDSLSHSIRSASQMVLIAEGKIRKKGRAPLGAAVIFQYKRSLRIYSLAVDAAWRMMGVGEALLQYILDFAASHGYERISLEADVDNVRLVEWYRSKGFQESRVLSDYYGPGEPAVRMVQLLASRKGQADRVVVVVDDLSVAKNRSSEIKFCSAEDYLSDTNYANSNRFHVLNLCGSYKTHSMGYYVSLLAAARNHQVTPSVMAVKDATTPMVAQSLLDELKDSILDRMSGRAGAVLELTCILGRTPDSRHAELARRLFALFSIPFFTIVLENQGAWKVKKIRLLKFKQVVADCPDLLDEALTRYCVKKRHNRQRLKSYKYDLGILVDPKEKTPPSCPKALEKFQKAAEKVGFFVEFITKADHRRICEFDALFIRETTALENHTYAMARHAYTEGLVVMDDPWSIMLCSNKVYLYERLAGAGIRQPRGWLLTQKTATPKKLASLPVPLVLKLPESSFSQGVYLVNTREELAAKLKEMFAKTDLVIAQEFLTSDYDWRIGVLDNAPLFACKYYMAENHWQIYNWQSCAEEEFSGRSEAMSVKQVPAHVIKAAVGASSLVGNGFYGVDIKEIKGRAYVIEVNDNPNVDVGVEDEFLGDELYERIMQSMFNRIETERQQIRYLY